MRNVLTFLLALCLTTAYSTQSWAQPADLSAREEAAFRAAVERVAPSVVKIETIGDIERVGDVLLGEAPTTGLIVSEDGYIVSSAFNFSQKPSSILVTLPDGARVPATLVAADKSRMLVLLKVEASTPLTAPQSAPVAELRPGQWTLAVGRTFDSPLPQYSIGVLSALDRIWGKAVQTDAKVSPNNYGGPLVDVQGRVIGVLAPFTPESGGESAGVEWYDSGIGFAVPLEHVLAALPRWREGKDLFPGIMGISLKSKDLYGEPPVIAVCRSDSPAYKAGLRVGDRIVAIDGREVNSQSQMKHLMGPHYSGDTVSVKVRRGEAEIERSIELIEKLDPYRHAFLGILPRRDPSTDGVRVRYVYPDSPAAQAGIKADDVIVAVGADQVTDVTSLRERLNGLAPEQSVRIEYRRAGATMYPDVKLASLPEKIPDSLPPAFAEGEPSEQERPATGHFTLELPEYPNRSLVYVPTDYDPATRVGLLIYLHPAGGEEEAKVLEKWTALCDREGLILLAPKSIEAERWQPDELAYIRRAIEHLNVRYKIDDQRIVACGQGAGATMAYLLGFQHRDLIRGVAALDGPMSSRPTENDPSERLAFYIAVAKKSGHAGLTAQVITLLRQMNYPITEHDLGETPRELNADEVNELGRWIDTLDKL